MKGMFLKKCDIDIYYQKCATVAQRFQLSMTKLGACDEIRWNDGTLQNSFKPILLWGGGRGRGGKFREYLMWLWIAITSMNSALSVLMLNWWVGGFMK